MTKLSPPAPAAAPEPTPTTAAGAAVFRTRPRNPHRQVFRPYRELSAFYQIILPAYNLLETARMDVVDEEDFLTTKSSKVVSTNI